jgi:sulfur carrier protein ThiS
MVLDVSRNEAPVITVRVVLFADLRRFLRKGENGPLMVTLPGGATVADLLAAIGITDTDEVTAGRNGEQTMHDATLNDGDEILLFSPMEGG